jgi:hypothetical protein
MVIPSVSWDETGAIAGAALTVLALLGIGYRYVLLPNLRDELRPMRSVDRELSGGPNEPSLRELVDELLHGHEKHSGEIEDATLELRAMALMFDGHLQWAQDEVDRLRHERQAMVDEIWDELGKRRAPGTGRHKRKDEQP